MSRTASLVKHSPRGGSAAVYPLTNTVRNPRGGMFDDEASTAYPPNLALDLGSVAKSLLTDEQKEAARKAGVNLDDPKALEEYLTKAKSVVTGEKAEDKKSDAKKEEVKKPRNKDEVIQSLALRSGIAVVSGAGAGVGVGMATKNPLLGAAAGVGAFLVAAVVSQLVDPIKPEDLDKVFKSDAKPSTSTSTATTKAAETPKK
jgi:hypothetical protein